MLPKVSVHRFSSAPFVDVENYRRLVGEALLEEIRCLARELAGIRVCHVNSTGWGGGVVELLSRLVPLSRALGVRTDWRLVQGPPTFFGVTKAFHNALQGNPHVLSEGEKAIYLHVNRESARQLEADYDVFIVHDPQPAAFRAEAGARGAKWIWRCHIDTSAPTSEVAAFLVPYLRAYDAAVFTLPDFVLPGLDPQRLAFVAPAIDPLSTKNMSLDRTVCREVAANAGIDVNRPLVVQVSRFDPWKDPMGVVEAYRLAKARVPGLQLALVGAIAGDDPEGFGLLAHVQASCADDDDVFVFTNLAGVGSMEVNAFQRACDLVVQKSLREGFGLVVSESFWKGRPIVAGRAGGIPLQFPDGYERFLVDDVETCAARMVELLEDPGLRQRFGEAGHAHVRAGFLLPRMLRDDLQLIVRVLRGDTPCAVERSSAASTPPS